MRILILTQWFTPEPDLKGLPFAKELVKLGHEVEVLTGFPNYPGGKLYPGYKIRLWQREVVEGIPVVRVALYPSHDRSSLRRIFNYLSFALSSTFLGPALVQKPDVVYVYNLVTLGLAVIALKLMKGCPFVYDVQDLWPESLSASGMLANKAALWAIGAWSVFVYARASRIVVLSPGFKSVLCKRGVPPEKIEVIYNWCDETRIDHGSADISRSAKEELAVKLGMSKRFNVLFAGNMGQAQALDAVLEAAKLISKAISEVQFVFIGSGVEVPRLKKKATDMECNNVLFLDRRPVSEIGRILVLADVLLVHLKNDPLFELTIPSKTQAYMAVGRPILMCVKGDAADLIQNAGAGISCVPEDPRSIAESVEMLFQMPQEERELMGLRGKEFYARELSLQVGTKRFQNLFESVIAR